MTRDEIVEAFAEAAHDAWLEEKMQRMIAAQGEDLLAGRQARPLTWPSETGEEQLIPWSVLSEPIRDFDRIVVGAIYDTMIEKGIIDG